MNMQPNLVTKPPTIILPAQITAIIDNLYDLRGDLTFYPLPALLELSELDLCKSAQAALKLDGVSAATNISFGISNAVAKHIGMAGPFATDAVSDLMFYLDGIVAFHELLMMPPQPFEQWVDDSLLYRGGYWTTLQFVLAADHYNCDPDILGLVVGHAWKLGKMHGLLTSNFDQRRCSKWLEASSQRGLNAMEPAPSSPLSKTLYRGGVQSPHLAHELSWTEDKETAVFFAERQPHGEPMVVSTQSRDCKVLARYEHESEVVLAYDANRQFKVEFF